MADAPTLPGRLSEQSLRFRSRLEAIRESAARQRAAGETGLEVGRSLARDIDQLLVDLLDHVVARSECAADPVRGAVLLVGGSGRGELAPYSDVDLLFLSPRGGREVFERLAAEAVRDCWDAGLRLGHSIHDPSGAIGLSIEEPEFATALLGARSLWGDRRLAETFVTEFDRLVVGRRRARLFADCVQARRAEWARRGLTASVLEPDVKRSPGGLRDIQLIGWLGRVACGSGDLDDLVRCGALDDDESDVLGRAHEFLVGVRLDLHLAAGRSQDMLTRDEQLRLTRERGVAESPGQRPVERFMQEYFRHSSQVARLAERFAARHHPLRAWERLVGRLRPAWPGGDYRVRDGLIDLAGRRSADPTAGLCETLELYHFAVIHRAQPSPRLADAIARAAVTWPDDVSARARQLFRDILDCPGFLGPVLRSMYEVGVLERLLPEIEHARCLMQFNQYHHFTVDEHTLRTIDACDAFLHDAGPIGTACRSINHKLLLHLSLLLHDLGKGFPEHHCEVGARLAADVGERFELPGADRDLLVFLVRHHLDMEQVAMRRDLSDPDVVTRFSRSVGSPETLRLLYVLTAADISAVGPGVWTSWKAELLTELYDRAMVMLGGEHSRHQLEQRLAEVRERVVAEAAAGNTAVDWLDGQLAAMSPQYLTGTPPDRIAADLAGVSRLRDDEVLVEGDWDDENGTLGIRVIAAEAFAGGCFHRIAGALRAHGLEIIGAQISTTRDGVAVDSFRVLDPDSAGPVSTFRVDEIATTVGEVLRCEVAVDELLERHRRFGADRRFRAISDLPTRVVLDNNSSDRCTIIDVFAHDRPGLLYTIAKTLYRLGLSVELAKIATHVDQVLDVFYVVDRDGGKVSDPEERERIREALEQAVDDLADAS